MCPYEESNVYPYEESAISPIWRVSFIGMTLYIESMSHELYHTHKESAISPIWRVSFVWVTLYIESMSYEPYHVSFVWVSHEPYLIYMCDPIYRVNVTGATSCLICMSVFVWVSLSHIICRGSMSQESYHTHEESAISPKSRVVIICVTWLYIYSGCVGRHVRNSKNCKKRGFGLHRM